MKSIEKRRESLVQNLKDAGCDKDTIEKYCQCCDCGDQRGKERYENENCEKFLLRLFDLVLPAACGLRFR